MERHGLPAWPWSEDRIVVLSKGLCLRNSGVTYMVTAIHVGRRLVLVQPLFDLFDLQLLEEAPARRETFETIATWHPTCNPPARPINERTWHDVVLDDDPV